jgi:4-amino-4-deoxy-L-arabinose transferase-like glycosyltransferase
MRYKITLFLIILLAAILRLYRLSEIPAINADEAAIGYNALSLLTNGLDEHGNAWPVHFQSFNDWKPGLIFYLVIPVVKLFGLTAFAIRVIPALFGVGTVVVLYFLIVELFKDNLKKDCRKFALAASFMLAISPWHIHFSRGAWEANVATFFTNIMFYARKTH